MVQFGMLCLFFLFLFLQQGSSQNPQPRIISRLPWQVGDSANHLVSSLGHEFGTGVGTIGRGVGEVPRAIGKAVGSVPEALGHGIGNFGDVGLDEGIHMAEAIGDTWRGAGTVVKEVVGGLAKGSHRIKRALEGLQDMTGMSLAQTAAKFRSTFQEVADVTLEQICTLITLLESYTTDEVMAQIAPENEMVKGIHNYLTKIDQAICSGVQSRKSYQY